MTRDDEEITSFVRANYGRLLRVAFLLCGDAGHAEDLVQGALAKTVVAWSRVQRSEGASNYVQRILVNSYVSARRRRSWWERPLGRVVESPAKDPYDAVDQRDWLRRAMDGLPARQRAAIVLRFYQDLSEKEASAVLGCSVGTVKSLASRGLRTLRQQLADSDIQGFGNSGAVIEHEVRYA
jgi:RNA polymerase sigma-70 factor (sigma-E family)